MYAYLLNLFKSQMSSCDYFRLSCLYDTQLVLCAIRNNATLTSSCLNDRSSIARTASTSLVSRWYAIANKPTSWLLHKKKEHPIIGCSRKRASNHWMVFFVVGAASLLVPISMAIQRQQRNLIEIVAHFSICFTGWRCSWPVSGARLAAKQRCSS